LSNPRTPLANVGGPVERRGDALYGIPLAAALKAQDVELDEFPLIHRFHSYPARMHPGIARSLLDSLRTPSRQVVFDPFCGSGTVAIEGMIAGYRTLGSDLNPLALKLARCKTKFRHDEGIREFLNALEEVSEASLERVRSRADSRADLPPEERRWYEVHVLKELAGLLAEIRKQPVHLRSPMEMVFSAIVVKFSKQRADTREEAVDKTIRKGLVSEFFVRKGQELAVAWSELGGLMPEKFHEPSFVLADASMVSKTLGGEFKCDLIITSPPYGGTYDYADHHARRMAWLGMSAPDLVRNEVGARRRYERPANPKVAAAHWDEEMRQVLLEMSRCLNVGGLAVLVVGDAQFGGEVFDAGEQIERLAPELGLEFASDVAQARIERHGSGERREHLVGLVRKDVELPSYETSPRLRGGEKNVAIPSRPRPALAREHGARAQVERAPESRQQGLHPQGRATPSRNSEDRRRNVSEVRTNSARQPSRAEDRQPATTRNRREESRDITPELSRPRNASRDPQSSHRSETRPRPHDRDRGRDLARGPAHQNQVSRSEARDDRKRSVDSRSSAPAHQRPPARGSRAARRARIAESSHWDAADVSEPTRNARDDLAWRDDQLAAEIVARESARAQARETQTDLSATYDARAMRLIEPKDRIGRPRSDRKDGARPGKKRRP
jgi:tRNA G10  N-methylase Trm11